MLGCGRECSAGRGDGCEGEGAAYDLCLFLYLDGASGSAVCKRSCIYKVIAQREFRRDLVVGGTKISAFC